MSNSEVKVIPFQSQRSISNKQDNIKLKKNDIGNLNTIPYNSSPSPSQKKTSFKTFLTSKKGIIILSVIGAIAVTSVIVSVVVTKIKKYEDTEENTDIHKSHYYGEQNDEIFEDEDDELYDNNDEEKEEFKSDIQKENLFIPPLSSLTQSNFMEFEIKEGSVRNVPSQTYIENEELIDYIPVYNENNKESTDNFYDAILEENKKLMASATNYDEIDENGNLFLKGENQLENNYININIVKIYMVEILMIMKNQLSKQ